MDHIRTWQDGRFTLDLWDTHKTDDYGKSILYYQFKHDAVLIFEGSDYCVGAATAIDSDEAVASLLGFFACCPGDADDEYFDKYTARQIEWRDEHAEDLSMIVCIMEEAQP